MPLIATAIGTAEVDTLVDAQQSVISNSTSDLISAIDSYDGTDATDIDAALVSIQTAAANAKQLIYLAAQA